MKESVIDLLLQIRYVEIIEFIGTFAFAINGIRGAATKNCDWFGAFVLGFVTAVGGGTLRDLLLDITPFWMLNSIYLWCTLLALLFYIFLREHLNHLNRFFFWSDSIGLGLFVVVGAEKAMLLGYNSWVIISMATITGIIGGILRDVFLNKIPQIFKREIYAFPCILGGSCFVFLQLFNFQLPFISIITVGVVVLLRYIAVKWDLQIPRLKSER
ncbi:trimeric intracellular cation channel family protein [Apibacter raozihei]|uniref:trimeric intracellular cation channel family protein n=1 Tax=Apibacter raozihei TaxID=2500547 RepID=UPI000FE34549|nr:trimeric intracellular cation channel family protein [Apibacter raozihei]